MTVETLAHWVEVTIASGGVVLAIVWLYLSPKTKRVAEDVVKKESTHLCTKFANEIARVDGRHDECREEMKEDIRTLSADLKESVKGIADQVQYLYRNEIERNRE